KINTTINLTHLNIIIHVRILDCKFIYFSYKVRDRNIDFSNTAAFASGTCSKDNNAVVAVDQTANPLAYDCSYEGLLYVVHEHVDNSDDKTAVVAFVAHENGIVYLNMISYLLVVCRPDGHVFHDAYRALPFHASHVVHAFL